MPNKPLFSIITITKDNLPELQTTAESVIAQENSALYEWIVQDGSEKSNTESWLKSQAPQHLRYKKERDEGIYDAMNRGLARTRGKYVIFMNSGDQFGNSQTLSNVALHINKHNLPDLIYGDALQDDRYKAALNHRYKFYGLFTHHQAIIYKRDLIGSTKYNTEYMIAADYDFTLSLLKRTDNVSYLNEPLCKFKSGGTSETNATVGRRESFEIRRQQNTCPLIINCAVYIANLTTYQLRNFASPIYQKLRYKS